MANPIKILKNGIINENPTFVQVIGMCPTLAVTSSAINGIGMGLSTTAVLIFANLFVSLLRKVIPDKVRIPCFIVVIATFVTIIEFMLKAYLPALNASLGLYIHLIVVNCIILARAEAFASKNGPIASVFDGIGMRKASRTRFRVEKRRLSPTDIPASTTRPPASAREQSRQARKS